MVTIVGARRSFILLSLIVFALSALVLVHGMDTTQILSMNVIPTVVHADNPVHTLTDPDTPRSYPGMESHLGDLYTASITAQDHTPRAMGGTGLPESGDQTIKVVIEMSDAGMPLPTDLGIAVEITYDNMIQATVPIASLDAIASAEGVEFVRLPLIPMTTSTISPTVVPTTLPVPHNMANPGNDAGGADVMDVLPLIRSQNNMNSEGAVPLLSPQPAPTPPPTRQNNVISEGAALISSDLMNQAGFTGKNIKVAVIDVGFDVTNPEISENIAEFRSFWYDSTIAGSSPTFTHHGTAAAEVIVDVAPDVDLYLYNFVTGLEFLNMVDHIIDEEIDVVSMSLLWNYVAPRDGTHIFSQKVQEAQSHGILWVTSTGNAAGHHWSGQFNDPDGDGTHNFGGGTDTTINIDVGADEILIVDLSWDDWNEPSHDFDMYLYDDQNNLLDRSTRNQFDGRSPHEWVFHRFSTNTTAHATIMNFSANRNVNFDIISSHPLNEYAVPGGSIPVPADSLGSLSVGAYDRANDVPHSYSSQGPTTDGRIKPDIMGPTDVSTTSYNPEPFKYTAASAPHVSGAAALLLEKYPEATVDQIRGLLEYTTADYHQKSNLDGTGLVDLSLFSDSDILVLDTSDRQCTSVELCFYPPTFSIAPGDTVTWVNVLDKPVRFTSDPAMNNMGSVETFDSGTLARGESFSMTFEMVGTLKYVDSAYPWATGQITVGPAPSTISGKVYNDINRNNMLDNGDLGLPDVELLVYDYVRDYANYIDTDADGAYSVSDVLPGQTALVQFVLPLPSEYLPVGGISNIVKHTPQLPTDDNTVLINFALYNVPSEEQGSVIFDVFDDMNGNGFKDAGEPGVPGATVFTFELLTYDTDAQVTNLNGITTHSGLNPDVVLAQTVYSDPFTGELLLPEGFTRITTENRGAQYVDVTPASTTVVQVGLGR